MVHEQCGQRAKPSCWPALLFSTRIQSTTGKARPSVLRCVLVLPIKSRPFYHGISQFVRLSPKRQTPSFRVFSLLHTLLCFLVVNNNSSLVIMSKAESSGMGKKNLASEEVECGPPTMEERVRMRRKAEKLHAALSDFLGYNTNNSDEDVDEPAGEVEPKSALQDVEQSGSQSSQRSSSKGALAHILNPSPPPPTTEEKGKWRMVHDAATYRKIEAEVERLLASVSTLPTVASATPRSQQPQASTDMPSGSGSQVEAAPKPVPGSLVAPVSPERTAPPSPVHSSDSESHSSDFPFPAAQPQPPRLPPSPNPTSPTTTLSNSPTVPDSNQERELEPRLQVGSGDRANALASLATDSWGDSYGASLFVDTPPAQPSEGELGSLQRADTLGIDIGADGEPYPGQRPRPRERTLPLSSSDDTVLLAGDDGAPVASTSSLTQPTNLLPSRKRKRAIEDATASTLELDADVDEGAGEDSEDDLGEDEDDEDVLRQTRQRARHAQHRDFESSDPRSPPRSQEVGLISFTDMGMPPLSSDHPYQPMSLPPNQMALFQNASYPVEPSNARRAGRPVVTGGQRGGARVVGGRDSRVGGPSAHPASAPSDERTDKTSGKGKGRGGRGH
ncbi:hypothetical protein DFP72DRAFT_870967 [Ephemerocybe angulata]|uniref:Uncharacterized protein n=1 Tax=Ephemerocybe angulata TaxID=980116 RepID=A0A8H6IH15_9AGAR|nr:hypothetical protein DFP72DRAFT_870967 [Tulosesus angulatus]